MAELKPGTAEWREHLDEIRQPEGAKIAIKEGGLIGKGPGRSTQKYTVALIFSDYMYSFIIEEYGLLFGGIPLIILYVSLLARGSIIVRYCDNEFARTVIAGLTLVISAQAMMHMWINAGLWPLTGQTLPMISDGKISFIAFSIAFGILLSISKMAKQKVDQAAMESGPLVVKSDDEVDELFLKVRGEILDAIREDSSRGEELLDLFMITKYYERIGDHATNIAEWVEYAITGERSAEN